MLVLPENILPHGDMTASSLELIICSLRQEQSGPAWRERATIVFRLAFLPFLALRCERPLRVRGHAFLPAAASVDVHRFLAVILQQGFSAPICSPFQTSPI